MYFILTEVATPRIRAPPPVKRSKPLWGLSCGAGVPTEASKSFITKTISPVKRSLNWTFGLDQRLH